MMLFCFSTFEEGNHIRKQGLVLKTVFENTWNTILMLFENYFYSSCFSKKKKKKTENQMYSLCVSLIFFVFRKKINFKNCKNMPNFFLKLKFD